MSLNNEKSGSALFATAVSILAVITIIFNIGVAWQGQKFEAFISEREHLIDRYQQIIDMLERRVNSIEENQARGEILEHRIQSLEDRLNGRRKEQR